MRKFALTILAAVGLLACSSDATDTKYSDWAVNDWERFSAARIVDNTLTIPPAPASANYVTRYGTLRGAHGIRIRFRLDGAVAPKNFPDRTPLATLYFQREGDNWSAKGAYETYRWYASFATVKLVAPGEYTMDAPLSARWTAIQGSNAYDQREAFQAAVQNAEKVGFVLGGGDGLGHGVTGPATLTIQEFTVY